MPVNRFDAPVGSTWKVPSAKYPGVWTVKSNTGPSNALLVQAGRRLRAPYGMLLPVTAAEPESAQPAAGLDVSFGSLVKYAPQPGKVFVVIAVKDKVNIAVLGGDGGRYWRAYRENLSAASAAEAAEFLGVAAA